MPQHRVTSLVIHHKIVLRVRDHLQIPLETMLVHSIKNTMPQVLISMKNQARRWKINTGKVYGVPDISRGLGAWDMSR